MANLIPVFVFLPKPTSSEAFREFHPYGPAPGDGFNTDLAIEINAAERPKSPALAVVKGKVVFIPDPSEPSTGTLLLVPWVDDLNALETVLGTTNAVFVYRNIDRDSIRPYLESKFDLGLQLQRSQVSPSKRKNVLPLDEAMALFFSGRYYSPLIEAGGELGLPALVGDQYVLGFEIALVPGAYYGGPGLDRLKQLIDPANHSTRRLDPTSFYHRVTRALDTVRLAPEHHGHLLLERLTQRTLLEVRNEYDRPWIGTLEIEFDRLKISHIFSAANRGTVVVAFASPPTPPPTGNYTFALNNHVFTELPSGTISGSSFTTQIDPPNHLAVETIFMADADDSRNWFVANTDPPAESRLPRFTPNNKITFLIDGLATFREMVTAMATVKNAEHYLRLAGWWLTDNFQMVPLLVGTKFTELTHESANHGAQVQGMLWDQFAHFNTAEVCHINDLPQGNGRAILDNETIRPAGSHHQKLLIVRNSSALPFCGGIDINPNRLDGPGHDGNRPYHDIHAKVEGPAVADLNITFVQRWNNHPERRSPFTCPGPVRTHPKLPATPPPFEPAPGEHYVQVTRTYPPKKHYPFAPNGDLGTLSAVRRAIQRAQRFIYLEDQYGTPYAGPHPYDPSKDDLGILSDLLDALDRIEYLIIVLCNHAGQPQGRYRRYNFIRSLRDKAETKVHVFYLFLERRRPAIGEDPEVEAYYRLMTDPDDPNPEPMPLGSGTGKYKDEIYVHSKIWIIDDVYTKIGSCNCNRRGYTHDSEADIHVIDGALLTGGRAFARRFRRELWAEHLNLTHSEKRLLDDPEYALVYWLNPPTGAHIRKYNENDYEKIHTDLNWNKTIDPDGR
jgi:phosphatidylserine/phosphatidylglycerophosphate/cardiolipin synthase-like enzyme